VGFEPTISAGERPQTYALDRAATGTGHQIVYDPYFHSAVNNLLSRECIVQQNKWRVFQVPAVAQLRSPFLIFMFPCIVISYTKMTNKMQQFRIIYYSLAALHVSSDIFAHHQEHLNCITASGITHVCRCRPAGSVLLGYGASSVDDWCPTIRDSVFSSSRVECPKSRNVGHQSSSARRFILEERRHKTKNSQIHSTLYDWLRNLCTKTSLTGVP